MQAELGEATAERDRLRVETERERSRASGALERLECLKKKEALQRERAMEEEAMSSALRAERRRKTAQIRWLEIVHCYVKKRAPDSYMQMAYSKGKFFVARGAPRPRLLGFYRDEYRRCMRVERLFRSSGARLAALQAKHKHVVDAAKDFVVGWERALPAIARSVDVKKLAHSMRARLEEDERWLRDFSPMPSARAVIMARQRLDVFDDAQSKPSVFSKLKHNIDTAPRHGKLWKDDRAMFVDVDTTGNSWASGFAAANETIAKSTP